MKKFLFLLLSVAVPAFAALRDVRRTLSENDFLRGSKLSEPVVAYPEPTMTSWPHGDHERPIYISEFDPLPTLSATLTTEQVQQLATILADRHAYSLSLGGKLCGSFHADVAIRVPGKDGGIYVLLCFGCNEICLQQHGTNLSFADVDRGRNQLLEFIRTIFPANEHFKMFRFEETKKSDRDRTKEALEGFESMIPDDPLLKHALTLKPEDVSEDDLEEIDVRCTAQMERWRAEEPAPQKQKSSVTVPK